ncbi:MAG: MaoC family dehydratase N-terminal domain-containing protein, partial [Pseudomonadota bacterium]|nr:MaoC family dehydratase N-terminal domain-containing protein [Pseudomonadota bacterium]
YFLPLSRRATLGADGLPTDTGVLPKMPLPRRMFAGGRFEFHAPIKVGDRLRRETELMDLSLREGSTGVLVFTKIANRIYNDNGLCVVEERDGVFREGLKPGEKSGIPKRDPVPEGLPWQKEMAPDVVQLFRFSAITFNPHRIHYDRTYAMEVEGYPGLVVHGPFTTQCLLDLVRDMNPDKTMKKFDMRARAPLFDTAPFTVCGRPTDDGCEVWAATPEGTVAMQARVEFA